MLRVAAVTALLAFALACDPPKSEEFSAGCSYADEVYDDIYDAGLQDAVNGVSILDASWDQIDCNGGGPEDWIEGCNTCALEAWKAGYDAALPWDPEGAE